MIPVQSVDELLARTVASARRTYDTRGELQPMIAMHWRERVLIATLAPTEDVPAAIGSVALMFSAVWGRPYASTFMVETWFRHHDRSAPLPERGQLARDAAAGATDVHTALVATVVPAEGPFVQHTDVVERAELSQLSVEPDVKSRPADLVRDGINRGVAAPTTKAGDPELEKVAVELALRYLCTLVVIDDGDGPPRMFAASPDAEG